MQLLTRKNAAILLAAALVLVSLSTANYFSWLRLKPEVSAIAWIAEKPDVESHVVNIQQRAADRVKGSVDAFFPVYDIQNPGFFLLVAELYTRAGATTPVPLQITSIVLFNIAAVCFFFWVYILFSDLLTATFATAFLAMSQFFLFFPGTTHTFPYEFVFFNITMLLFVSFLKTNSRGYLVGSLIAMFMTCMNYWFYYMSSWIIMVGLWWQYRGRPRIKDVAILSAPPVAAAAFTAIMVISLFGGVKAGVMRLASILVARMFDARIPGGTWYPDQRFMDAADWYNYPARVVIRLEWAYSFEFYSFAAAAGCVALVLLFRDRKSLVSALILLLGGTSWYYVMFQHTHIHHFVGQYSFMAICPIFGLISSQTLKVIWEALKRAFSIVLATAGTGQQAGADGSESPVSLRQGSLAVTYVATAAVLIAACYDMLEPYVDKTSALIEKTISLSSTVEAKYADAVQAICRQHSDVTLADLTTASSDWGFEWRPQLIAETNRMPKCPG